MEEVRAATGMGEVVGAHLDVLALGELRLGSTDDAAGLALSQVDSGARPKFGASLVVLALARGEHCGYPTLHRATWGRPYADSNRQGMQNAAAFWRKMLRRGCERMGCDHPSLLTNEREGYVLTDGAVRMTDVAELIDLTRRADAALRAGRPADAGSLVDRGRRLFRGRPYDDVHGVDILPARRAAIDHLLTLLASGVVAALLTGAVDRPDERRRVEGLLQAMEDGLATAELDIGGPDPLRRFTVVVAALRGLLLHRQGTDVACREHLVAAARATTDSAARYAIETLERVLRSQGSDTGSPEFAIGLLGLPDDMSALDGAMTIVAPQPPPLEPTRPEHGPFVGREDLLERLRRPEARRLHLVVGEAGVGKTSLLQQLVNADADAGHLQIVCRCAIEPLPEVIHDYVRGLGPFRLEPVLGEALVRQLAEADPLGEAQPEQVRLGHEQALCSALGRLGRRFRLTIYLDDLHLAHGSTLALLIELVRREIDVVLVATTRPSNSPDSPIAELSNRSDRLDVIGQGLDPLDRDEIGQFAESMLGRAADIGPVVSYLIDKTQGNALFLSELMRFLTEHEGLVIDGETWRVVEGLAVGEALATFVSGRVASLPAATQEALRLLSCSEQATPYPIAVRLIPTGLVDAVEPATAAGLLQLDADHQSGGIRFRHELLREAVYEAIDPVARWRYHERLGDAATDHDTPAAVYFRAYHYERAVFLDARRAVDALEAAGRQALDDLEIERAADSFRLARGHSTNFAEPDRRRQAELLFLEGDCRRRVGQDGHRELLLQAARLADQHGAVEITASAAISLADAGSGFHAGILDTEIADLLNRAADRLPEQAIALRARLRAAIAVLVSQTDMQATRIREYEEAVELAERSGDLATVVAVLPTAYWVYDAPGDTDLRHDAGRQLLALASTGGSRAEFEGHRLLFSTAVQLGDFEGAIVSHRRSEELLEDLPEPACWWAFEYQRTLLTYLRGDLAASEASAERCRELARRAGMPETRQLTVHSAQILAIRDDQGRISEIARDMIAAANQLPGVPAWQCGKVVAQFALGHDRAALATFDQIAAAGFYRDLADLAWLGGLVFMARHAAALLPEQAVSSLLAEIEPWSGRNSWVAATSFGPVDQALGLLHLHLGRLDRADELFASAGALAERLDSPGYRARAQLGRAAVAGPRAECELGRELVAEARDLIDGRGMAGIEVEASGLDELLSGR